MKLFFKAMVMILVFLSQSIAQAGDNPQKFKGIEITVGVQDESAISSPAIAHGKTWEERTGAKVNVVKMPFSQLFGEYMKAMTSEKAKFDVILFASAWAGDFFPYLSEIPKSLTEGEAFDDIHDTYRERMMKWGDKWIAVSIDGDLFNGYYRKDLFEADQNRKDFKSKYGYDLAPPDTWKQYRDIAEFFTGRTDIDGKTLYGAAEVFAAGGHRFWNLSSRASAYVNNPANPGAQFFDPDTMKAQISNPGWVKALEEYVEILKFAPPNSISFRLDDVRKAFCTGTAVMTMEWGDTGQISSDPKQSSVVGKVGYFILPGTSEVWNYKTGKWDDKSPHYKAPFLAFGGWTAGVPKNTDKKDAAWDYIMWYGNKENGLHDVVTAGTGVNPYRYSHFTNVDAWTAAFSKKAAAEYLSVLRNSLDSPSAALDLRIPGFNDYTQALDAQLDRVFKKEISAKQALEQTAAEWEKITDKLGRDKQLSIYRASMGLIKKLGVTQLKFIVRKCYDIVYESSEIQCR